MQKFHRKPTPRIGGLGIFFGLLIAFDLAPTEVRFLIFPMLVGGLPAFVFGLAEDLTKRVGIRERLLATMASGLLACWLAGTSLTRVDVPGLDTLLAWLPVSLLFTAFAVGGVANAVNIIDGFNGLAAGVILVGLSSLGFTAYLAGDVTLAKVCFVLGGVTGGFLLMNFPLGKIFLGDGGAYFLGFCLAWVALLLPMRNPGVSAWASLMACGYPVMEALFSIARRYRRATHVGHPDRLHLHSLIKRRLSRIQLKHWPLTFQNAAVSPLVWILASLPAVLGVLFRQHTGTLVVLFLACALLYALFYARLACFRWTLPQLRLR